jgi:hypothetical protein
VNADVDFPTEEVLRRIDEHEDEIKGAVVRLMIEITPERLRDLRQDEIRRALNAKGPSFSAVVANTTRTHRIRLGDQVIEQMSPRQALEIYLQSRDTSPERIELLLRHYDKLNTSIADTGTHTVTD